MSSDANYGTVPNMSRQQPPPPGPSPPSEDSGLLPKPGPNVARSRRLATHLRVPIARSRADIVLLACYLITGLLDSSAVYIWGSFVSMQTGNTVYVGLGLVEASSSSSSASLLSSSSSSSSTSDRWIRSLISICSFCLGSFCFSRFHRLSVSNDKPHTRWVVLVSFGIQLMLIIAAAAMVHSGAATPSPGSACLEARVIIPLAMLAFQSSGQAVASRVFKYNGLPSVVLTSTYCDLWSDPNLFTAGLTENAERNRRIAAPLLLLAGACCGGLFAKSPLGLTGALWTAAGLKAAIVCAWICWEGEVEEEEQQS